jgi:hypothetical protein
MLGFGAHRGFRRHRRCSWPGLELVRVIWRRAGGAVCVSASLELIRARRCSGGAALVGLELPGVYSLRVCGGPGFELVAVFRAQLRSARLVCPGSTFDVTPLPGVELILAAAARGGYVCDGFGTKLRVDRQTGGCGVRGRFARLILRFFGACAAARRIVCLILIGPRPHSCLKLVGWRVRLRLLLRFRLRLAGAPLVWGLTFPRWPILGLVMIAAFAVCA